MSQLRAAVSVNNQVTGQLLKKSATSISRQPSGRHERSGARALHYQQQVAQALQLAAAGADRGPRRLFWLVGKRTGWSRHRCLQEVPTRSPRPRIRRALSAGQGADQPTETRHGQTVDVNIKQTQQRAILSWETFNVGQHTILNFDQSYKGQAEPGWVVLNIASLAIQFAPAEILGQIRAQGTVLIIDPTDILFGGHRKSTSIR